MLRRRRGSLTIVVASLGVGAWTLVSAQRPAGPSRAISWEKAREAIGKYRAVPDNSGLVEIDNSLPAVDAEDLPALCRARDLALEHARARAATALAEVGTFEDPISNEHRSAVERTLASIATYSGDVDGAIRHFTAGRDSLTPFLADYPDLQPKYLVLLEALGVANLRRGEIDNCLIMSTPDRCLFPLRPGGVHQDRKSVV